MDAVLLRAECERRGTWISPDGRVRERDAAILMGCSAKRLKNRRAELDDRLPSFVKRNGRVLYSLVSIAAWMAKS